MRLHLFSISWGDYLSPPLLKPPLLRLQGGNRAGGEGQPAAGWDLGTQGPGDRSYGPGLQAGGLCGTEPGSQPGKELHLAGDRSRCSVQHAQDEECAVSVLGAHQTTPDTPRNGAGHRRNWSFVLFCSAFGPGFHSNHTHPSTLDQFSTSSEFGFVHTSGQVHQDHLH